MAKKAETKTEDSAPARRRPGKKATAFNLPEDLLDRARNTVFWVPGLTMARLAEEGIALAIAEYERAHNRGKPFKAREGALMAGRPMGS